MGKTSQLEETRTLLAEHGPLGAHLEHEPALQQPLVLEPVVPVREPALSVVRSDEVIYDGAGLPERHALVWVDHAGQAPVRVQGGVRLGLDLAVRDPDDVVRQAELLEHDDDLPRVRPLAVRPVVHLDGLHGDSR